METPASSPLSTAQPLAPLVAPTLSVSSPPSGLAGTTVTLTGTAFTAVTGVAFGAVAATSFTVVSPTRITAVAPPGAGTVQITVTTGGGTSNGIDFTYTTATPVIASAVPNQGPVAGGNVVTLTGSGLNGATAVRFGFAPAGFIVVSPTQVTVLVPAGVAGPVAVTLTTPGGTSAGVFYTYVTAPTLSGVAPGQGPVAGGNTVTLTGGGFTGATAVRFGALPAASFTVVSATQITAVVPTGAAGAAGVTVTTAGGTTPGDVLYYYLPVPVLTGVAPAAGPTAGGTSVTLTGSGLLTATAVRLGVTSAAFTVVSDIQLTATAPPGAAGTAAVTVVTPGGTSNAGGYAYLPVPGLTGVAPNQGPVAGGTNVALTGTALSAAAQVRFGAVPAGFTAVSDTQLTATAPPGAAGATAVTVVTPGGTSSAVPYTWLAPPAI